MPAKMGRPRKDPKHARESRSMRCHPHTWKALERIARNRKQGLGACLDDLLADHGAVALNEWWIAVPKELPKGYRK